jgi:hypothetical protein
MRGKRVRIHANGGPHSVAVDRPHPSSFIAACAVAICRTDDRADFTSDGVACSDSDRRTDDHTDFTSDVVADADADDCVTDALADADADSCSYRDGHLTLRVLELLGFQVSGL